MPSSRACTASSDFGFEPRSVDVLSQLSDRRVPPRIDVGGDRATEQQGQVFDSRAGLLKDGLEQQVQEEIVAPDVEDEGDRRPDVRDVGEVLVGTDADVGATSDACAGPGPAAPPGTSARSKSGCRYRSIRRVPRAPRFASQTEFAAALPAEARHPILKASRRRRALSQTERQDRRFASKFCESRTSESAGPNSISPHCTVG